MEDCVKAQCPMCHGGGLIPVIMGMVPIQKGGPFNKWFANAAKKCLALGEKLGIAPFRFTPPGTRKSVPEFTGTEAKHAAPSGHDKDLDILKERQRDVTKFGPEAIPREELGLDGKDKPKIIQLPRR